MFEISQNGLNLIKSFESLRLTAYKGDGETYWTIGWGHYGPDVYEGMTITEEEAEEILRNDMIRFVNSTNEIAVSKFPEMNQNQFDALVSYCYNRGEGKTDGSNGLRQIIYNSNTLSEVSNNFLVYWGTNQSAYEGLMNRRKKEKALFDTPIGDVPDPDPDPDPSPIKFKKRKFKFVLFNSRRRFLNWKKKRF